MQIDAVSQSKYCNFNGKYTQTENGTPYYKTNNALKAGAVMGALGLLCSSFTAESKIAALLSLGIDCGIGAYIDYKRNEKAAEAADYLRQVGLRNALATRNDIRLNDENKPYYKSKEGTKFLTIMGTVIGALIGLFPSTLIARMGEAMKDKKGKAFLAGSSVLLVAISTGIGALDGFITGKIFDYFTNRSAKKHA